MTVSSGPASRFGVIGGLGPLAGAEQFLKVFEEAAARGNAGPVDAVLEHYPFRDANASRAATTARKLYIFDMIRAFERRGVTTIALPCFLSHTFIGQLQENSSLHIVDVLDGLRSHVRRFFPHVCRIGVLTSGYMRDERLFERYFTAPEFEVLHPRARAAGDVDLVTSAICGEEGIESGNLTGRPVELLREACADLITQGAEVILPGMAEIALVAKQIGPIHATLIDWHLVYAQYVLAEQHHKPSRVFKVGVVGGVGPAATVDFLQKVVRGTPATRDQDHIKVLVEQNPQIPDRTKHLVGDGPDPTVSLYATCKRLEAGDVGIIAIPCNTAHAFVERIQPYLNVPIVNMLTVTAEYLRATYPELRRVGLLATTGTIMSGVYQKALEAYGMTQIVPSNASQARVMNAIFGPSGVKAGCTVGECINDVTAGADDLIEQGVEVIILGCTELPLLLAKGEIGSASGRVARLVDPTDILAKRCVAYARGELTPEPVGAHARTA
jgi:aspartate racemase